MKAKLDENEKQIRAGNAVASKIWGALRPDWYRRLGQELQSSMKKIYMMNISTYNAVINIQERLLSHLERGLIRSWEAFEFGLEDQFRNVQGYKMVQNKAYVIQHPSTRRDIDQSLPWETSFLPGQKVVMSMLFTEEGGSTTSCPRCQTSSEEQQTSDVLW